MVTQALHTHPMVAGSGLQLHEIVVESEADFDLISPIARLFRAKSDH